MEKEMVISKSPTLERLNIANNLDSLRDKPRERVWEIDFLRGFFFLAVVLYHMAWDMAFMPDMIFSNSASAMVANPIITNLIEWCYDVLVSKPMEYLVNIFSGAFLVLTGISCSFSRSNIKRSFRTCLIALAITYVSYIASVVTNSEMTIVFGILHNMGLTLFIYSIFEVVCKWLKVRMNPWVIMVIGLGMLGYGLYLTYWTKVPVYSFNKLNPERLASVILGFSYTYTDDFGMFPHSGKILIGIAIGMLLYKEKKSLLPRIDGRWNRPLCFLGRHTFLVYIIHQPIIWTLMTIVLMCFGFRL